MFGVSAAKIDNSYQFQTKTDVEGEEGQKISCEGCLQNGQITQFYFKKLKEQEIALSLIVLVNLYLIVFSANLSFPVVTQQHINTLQFCLYFTVISSGIAVVLVGMRTITALQLQKERKILYDKATLITSKKMLYMLLEWVILMIQPYPFFIGRTFASSNQYQKLTIDYPVNDVLAILSFGRVYILIRTALLLTPYMDNRANRLCKMYGCRANFSYSLKCMFKDHPLKLICLFYFLSVAIFAYLIYLAERPITGDPSMDISSAATNYQNSLWLILITTTTVGYGDYFPQTPIGRVIILFVAIWGTLIVSIMVVVVSNTLSMEKTQLRTSKILNKLQLKQQLEEKAGKTIGYFMLVSSKLKTNSHLQNLRKMLKHKSQFTQIRKSIKEMAQVNDLEDEIASHFLKLNSDIKTLNTNQDKIINFIHRNFNATSAGQPQPSDPQSEDEEEGREKEPATFLRLFNSGMKQKVS